MRGWTAAGIGLLAGAGVLCLDATPTYSLATTILHTPPASYQQMGPCAPNLGTPYEDAQQQNDAPILFYYGGELTKIMLLLKEQDIRTGRTWTLLNGLGGIPIANMGFTFSQQNPFNKQPGSYYLLTLTVDRGQRKTVFPC
jgi:hypothetical protein